MDQVIESRIQLFSALSEAAELEHNLMCLYLYAALGLKRSTEEGVTDAQLAAITRWRKAIMGVALEEMTHLTLVANLISACGASLNFMRPNFPVSPGYYPADIVVELAPFDMSTIEHFIYLERPETHDVGDGASFPHRAKYTREAPHGTLMPHASDYPTVGSLYRSIRTAIEHMCEQAGEARLFLGSRSRQIGPLDSPLPGLTLVTDRASAVRALDTIVIQGEGARTAEGSHFSKFQAIRDEYAALLVVDPTFVPGRRVARNPVMRSPANPENRVWVRAPLAARYMDLANTLYTFMLRVLVQVYAVEHRAPSSKRALVETAVDAMHAMATVAETLTHLDADASAPGVRAGISFAMVRSLAPIEADIESTLLVERLGEVGRGFAELQHELELERGNGADLDTCIDSLVESAALIDGCRKRIAAAPYASTQVATTPIAPPRPAAPPVEARATDLGPGEVARGKKLTMVFDAKRCIHSRHCVTELPRVFLANTPGEWLFPDEADANLLAAVIRECPSGALHYERHDGQVGETVPEVNMIRIRENGPYAVLADLALAGREDAGYRAVLCRCGLSKNKPLCDGSHNAGNFQATGEPVTVDNTALPDRAGTLAITPTPNGPLRVSGNVEICANTGRIVLRTSGVNLCRCGQSKTKPICDGSHVAAGFVSEDPAPRSGGRAG